MNQIVMMGIERPTGVEPLSRPAGFRARPGAEPGRAPGDRRKRPALRFAWLWVAMPVLAALPGTFGALTLLFPRDSGPADGAVVMEAGAEPASPSGAVGIGNRAPLVGSPPYGATTAMPPDAPVEATGPIDPLLEADLAAFAETLRARLPVETASPTLARTHRLVSVDVRGGQIVLQYDVAFDLGIDMLTYDPEPILPNILGWVCEGGICIEIAQGFYAQACNGPLAGLIKRGAVAVYVYDDIGHRPIARVPVTATHCPAQL